MSIPLAEVTAAVIIYLADGGYTEEDDIDFSRVKSLEELINVLADLGFDEPEELLLSLIVAE